MLVITAKMKAAKGKEKELVNQIKRIVSAVRQNENSTPLYIAHRSMSEQTEFFFYEQYLDRDAFIRHRSASYSKEFLDVLPALVDGDVVVEEYETLGVD